MPHQLMLFIESCRYLVALVFIVPHESCIMCGVCIVTNLVHIVLHTGDLFMSLVGGVYRCFYSPPHW